jgi:hypothetical protein
MSERYTGEPPLPASPPEYAITSGLYCALVSNWSLAPMECASRGPSKLPFAWFTLAVASAARRSSKFNPRADISVGFTLIRTAGFCPPLMLTSPTPES